MKKSDNTIIKFNASTLQSCVGVRHMTYVHVDATTYINVRVNGTSAKSLTAVVMTTDGRQSLFFLSLLIVLFDMPRTKQTFSLKQIKPIFT